MIVQVVVADQLVSVIVCTRDRAGQLERSLESILTSSYRNFELIVVDQSDDTESASLVNALHEQDSRIRLVRDERRGLSRARNLGVAQASTQYIAFTDDDCEPAVDWLELVVGALAADRGAGVAFGAVIPAPFDPAIGFIDGYVPGRQRRLTGRFSKLLDGGIGANMAYRREAIEAAGGFDEMLGAGGYFASCEDGDMAYRVLARGYALLHLPQARVLHHGLREWHAGKALTRRTYVAVAAAYIKYVRLGDPVGACLIVHQFGLAMLTILRAVAQRRGPYGFGRLAALAIGLWRSFELGVEPQHGLYRQRA